MIKLLDILLQAINLIGVTPISDLQYIEIDQSGGSEEASPKPTKSPGFVVSIRQYVVDK